MRKKLLFAALAAVMIAGLLLPAAAAPTPEVAVSCTPAGSGSYTVRVAFANVPQDNPVEYAQILLTCRSAQHDLTANSLNAQVTDEAMLMTHVFQSTADSLLVLIEPTRSDFAGIGNTGVYTFSLVHSGGQTAAPAFDLSAVLILKDGTEYEQNLRLTTYLTGLCAGGHRYAAGLCAVCGAKEPATSPSSTPTSGTTQPTASSSTQPSSDPVTQPSVSGTTLPSTAPGDPQPAPVEGNWILLALLFGVIVLLAGFFGILAFLRKKS